jgi:hypothetical protein
MPTITDQQIADALTAAKAAALKVADTEDGGTCNFDCAIIRGITITKMRKASAVSGVAFFPDKWLGRQCFFIHGFLQGQGFRRTKMAEAACAALRAAGLDAHMYYQMD